MKLINAIAAAAVIGSSFITANPAKAGHCFESSISEDMNELILEGRTLSEAWKEQIRIGTSDGSNYCWRRTKATIRTYRTVLPALYNAVFK